MKQTTVRGIYILMLINIIYFSSFMECFNILDPQTFRSLATPNHKQTACNKETTICLAPSEPCNFEGQQTSCTSNRVCRSCFGFGVCTNNICPSKYIGSSCILDTQCKGTLDASPAVCRNSICVPLNASYLWANDYCDNETQCIANLTCTSGRCKGRTVNETCASNAECDYNLICLGGSCQNAKKSGESCAGDQCQLGLICQGGKCSPYFSQPVNASCAFCGCADDLICATDINSDTCKPYLRNGQACNSASDCPADSLGCFCDPDTGSFKCHANVAGVHCNDCRDKFSLGVDCLIENKCKNGELIKGSCAYEKCGDLIQAGRECFYENVNQCAFKLSSEDSATSLKPFAFLDNILS